MDQIFALIKEGYDQDVCINRIIIWSKVRIMRRDMWPHVRVNETLVIKSLHESNIYNQTSTVIDVIYGKKLVLIETLAISVRINGIESCSDRFDFRPMIAI